MAFVYQIPQWTSCRKFSKNSGYNTEFNIIASGFKPLITRINRESYVDRTQAIFENFEMIQRDKNVNVKYKPVEQCFRDENSTLFLPSSCFCQKAATTTETQKKIII